VRQLALEHFIESADLDSNLHDCLINKFFPSRAAVLSAREFVEAS
jgi:hypothetical protein